MTDPRLVEVQTNTIKALQDEIEMHLDTIRSLEREITARKTMELTLKNRIHELEHKNLFLNHTDYEIPVIDIVADPTRDKL